MNYPPLEKIPPHSLDAETCVLGSMLIDRMAIDKVQEILKPDDFYRGANKMVFEAMISLHERAEAVDIVTVKNELSRRDELDKIGGVAYLADVMESVPSASNAEYYARIVEDKAILRKLQSAAQNILQLVDKEEEQIETTIDRAEQIIYTVGQRRLDHDFVHIKPIIHEVYDRIEQFSIAGKDVIGVSSGFDTLDVMTAGFQPSDLLILAARPSMGKTSLALAFALNAAIKEETTVAIFSLEMSKEQLVLRLLSAESGVNGQKMRSSSKMTEDDWHKLVHASNKLYKAKLWIEDSSETTSTEMRAKLRRLKAEHGLGLVIVDYLQLMRGSRRTENRVQEISEIARSLKSLARELQVPVIALSQLSRAVEHRENKRPMLSDLRESGSIEAEADVVMFIYRDQYYKQRESPQENQEDMARTPSEARFEEAEILIAKQRNGPVGMVKLAFYPDFALFRKLSYSNE